MDISGSENLICREFTFYRVRKNGRATCKQCPICTAAGFGLNKTVVRLENEHGILSCYPCERCPAGTYREFTSVDPKCKPCTLDCIRSNRYASVECGDANPGHCGDCLLGYFADSKEPNSICQTNPPEQSKIVQRNTTTMSPINHKSGITENVDFHAKFAVWLPAALLSLLTIIVIGCATAVAVHHRRNRKQRKTKNIAASFVTDSKRALITSKSSSIGYWNDLDIDGGGHQLPRARGELPEVITEDELVALVKGCGQATGPRGIDSKEVNKDRVLGETDATLVVVSDYVSGERRHELFHTYLKIEKSKTDPEQELWMSGAIKHSDYILNVLKIWLRRGAKSANLGALCDALEMASFGFIVDKILNLPENQKTSSPSEEFVKILTDETGFTPYGNTHNITNDASFYCPSKENADGLIVLAEEI